MRACQPKDLKRREWRSTRGREREREKKKECMHAGEAERECFGSSFYMFFLPLGLPYAN